MLNSKYNVRHEVSAIVKRKDGTIEDLGIIATVPQKKEDNKLVSLIKKIKKGGFFKWQM
jgi:hypothetical protein